MKTQDLFADYPDLVNVKQFQTMMGGISVKAVYQCLHDGEVNRNRIDSKGQQTPGGSHAGGDTNEISLAGCER